MLFAKDEAGYKHYDKAQQIIKQLKKACYES